MIYRPSESAREGLVLCPNLEDIERFTRWRFYPFRTGYLIRAQLYGGALRKGVEQWRIKLANQDEPSRLIREERHPHWREEVASMESLVRVMCKLATRAAEKGCNVAVAPTLFDDGRAMSKNEVHLWLGFGIDFDMKSKDGKLVGPLE